MTALMVTQIPDVRHGMEWDKPYDREGPALCTFCGWEGMLRTDTVVVKVRWGRQPDGHLLTLCPPHADKWAGAAAA